MHSPRSALLSLFILSALATSPSLLRAQAGTGSIVGQVRISPGSLPPAPILINVETRGATVSSAYTDNEGRFGVNGLPGNIYHVIINDPDYQPFEEAVNMNPATNPMQMVNIFLMPKDKGKALDVPSLRGGNKNLADLSQYTKRVPKKAIKEFDAGVKSDQKNKIDDAIKHYQGALALAPDFYPAHNNLGSDLVKKTEFPSAEQQFEAAIHINPSDASAYFNLGNLYLLTKRYADAREWVDRGLSRQPDSAFGHFIRGTVLTRTGDLRQAEIALRRSLELDPIMAKAHLALVNLYLQQQRTQEAVAELRIFVSGFPEDPAAPHAKELLHKLGGTTESTR